jgi:ABC-type branched-subunit amino acid transport system substrate-binding protein
VFDQALALFAKSVYRMPAVTRDGAADIPVRFMGDPTMALHSTSRLLRLSVITVAGALAMGACSSDPAAAPAPTPSKETATVVVDTTLVPDTAAPGTTPTADTAAETTIAADTTVAPVACTGDPIKIMMIVSLTGAVSFPHASDGFTAAEHAVNASCQLGRPLKVIQCDDKYDPNVALECARQAVDEKVVTVAGSLSLLGDAAVDIFTKEGISHFCNTGTTQADVTNPLSYPCNSTVAFILGEVKAAAALGKTSVAIVGAQMPAVQFIASQAESLAADAGLSYAGYVGYNPGTTDFAPIAAQISATGADSVIFLVSDPEVEAMLKALVGEGVDFKKTAVFFPAPTVQQPVIDKFDGAVNGLMMGNTHWPSTDVSNPGIAQLVAEMEAAGLDPASRTEASVGGYVAVHVFADIAEAIGVDGLDSAKFAAALASVGALDRPELGRVDWSKPAMTKAPFDAFRIFSSDVIFSEVVDGKIIPISDFVDINQSFELTQQ